MCVHPSIHHAISSYITERNLTKFATSWRPSIGPYLLLNQWAQFNRTCYMTYPYGKCVREQNYFPSVRPSGVRPSVCYLLLNHWVHVHQTCYMTSPHGKSVRSKIIFPSVCPCPFFTMSVRPSLYLDPSKPLGRI